jgi:RNA polymerase sigma factor for flagellar operon FliA
VTLTLPALSARPRHARAESDDHVEADALITSHLPLVGHIVREALGRVPAHVNRDDLLSAGMLALTMAAQSFDSSRGVPFTSFAGIRIRGAITDELRSMDWASRAVRTRAREVEGARDKLVYALGRTPTRTEIAAELGLTERDVAAVQQDVHRAGLLSVEALTPQRRTELPVSHDDPESALMQRETLAQLRDAITELPDRLRTVVEEYFFGQRRMGDIAAEFGVTESRVSQLRSEALELLRAGLAAVNAGSEPAVSASPLSRRRANARATYCAAVVARAQGTAGGTDTTYRLPAVG